MQKGEGNNHFARQNAKKKPKKLAYLANYQ